MMTLRTRRPLPHLVIPAVLRPHSHPVLGLPPRKRVEGGHTASIASLTRSDERGGGWSDVIDY